MQKLITTSIATCVIMIIAIAGLKMADAPLGGQPYTIVTIKERSQAEAQLKTLEKKKAADKLQKPKEKASQKTPVYFSGEKPKSTSKTNAMDEPAIKVPFALTDKQKTDAHKEVNNQLEYIAKIGLPPAPNPDFIEQTKHGMLPRVSDDGRRPLDVYKRPAAKLSKNSKSIAIVITGLGLSQPLTEQALEHLPPDVTFSFNPYANNLKTWMKRTRSAGHETVLEIPMEPFDFPDNDPGPHTLLTYISDRINIERLNWLLARMTGYVGIINLDGGKFIHDENAIYPVMRETKNRGLLYMDANPEVQKAPLKVSSELKLEYLHSTLVIDQIGKKEAIDATLAKLEEAAQTHGKAIGIAAASPLVIQRLREWAEELNKRGVNLIPLSATIARKQS